VGLAGLLDFQRPAGQILCFASGLRWRRKTPKPGRRAHISQPDMGRRKRGILVDRLPKYSAPFFNPSAVRWTQ
jgi:hypothetical protein